jgi:autotransporter-associated beta strand protein
MFLDGNGNPGILTNLSTNVQTLDMGLNIELTTADINTASNSIILNGVIDGTNITKSGASTLFLNGTNTFIGILTNTAGAVRVGNNAGLGTTAGGTVIQDGTALELTTNNAGGNISIGAEALTISGTGISANGALRNITGSNTFGGAITLAAASQIQSDAGTLVLSSTIGGNFLKTFTGAGNITASGVVSGTTGVTKDGAGTLILTGLNTYGGTTTIGGGVLRVTNGANAGTSSGIGTNASVAISKGGAMDYAGTTNAGSWLASPRRQSRRRLRSPAALRCPPRRQ